MDFSTHSISNTISKDTVNEEMSMFRASVEDAASRIRDGLKPETFSNEIIHNGDEILKTYQVASDAIYGGMGSVWKVYHKSWNVDLAMKRPQPKFFAEGSEKRKEAFISECENWINLGLHPNIVSCFYVREIGGIPTIFAEWMDGGSLKDRIRDRTLYQGTENEIQERILDIAIQTARGLRYAHESEEHLIHQDVKPGNILLTKEWEARVADFGLAKAQSQLSSGEQLSHGYTIEYCPKEQAEGAPAQPWMDVFSWALTVLEMYAGARFWESGAEVKEQFDSVRPQLRIPVPDSVFELLHSCIMGTIHNFEIPENRLADAYAILNGNAYPGMKLKAAADTSESLNNRALSYLDLGKTEEAERLWETALEKNPGNMRSLYNLSLVRWRKAQYADLQIDQDLTGAVKGMPDQAEAITMMLMFQAERGDRVRLEQWMSEAGKHSVRVRGDLKNTIDTILQEDSFIPCTDEAAEGLEPAAEDDPYRLESSDYGGTVEQVSIYEKASGRLRHSFVVPGYREKAQRYSKYGIGSFSYYSGFDYYQGNIVLLKDKDLDPNIRRVKIYARWHFVIPDYAAPFVLSKIEDYYAQTAREKRFQTLLRIAEKQYAARSYSACMKSIEEATAIPGCENEPRILELERKCGNEACTKTEIRTIRRVPFPEEAVPDPKYDYHGPIEFRGWMDADYYSCGQNERTVSVSFGEKKACGELGFLMKDEGIVGELEIRGEGRKWWGSNAKNAYRYEDGIFDLAFSPCGNYLLVIAASETELRDVRNNDDEIIWRTGGCVGRGYFADHGRYMIVGKTAWELRYYYRCDHSSEEDSGCCMDGAEKQIPDSVCETASVASEPVPDINTAEKGADIPEKRKKKKRRRFRFGGKRR